VEKSIAYAYVPVAHADPGTEVTIDVFGRWIGGRVVAEPLYDPAGQRVKGSQTGTAATPTIG
jgi:glycine cleavage system aminomethyltransferase T